MAFRALALPFCEGLCRACWPVQLLRNDRPFMANDIGLSAIQRPADSCLGLLSIRVNNPRLNLSTFVPDLADWTGVTFICKMSSTCRIRYGPGLSVKQPTASARSESRDGHHTYFDFGRSTVSMLLLAGNPSST